MRLAWALLLGLAGGIGVAWWLGREPPDRTREKALRAQAAAAANAEDARPVLYRWHDADGGLHVTSHPPKGRRFVRVPIDASPAIEVDGTRE